MMMMMMCVRVDVYVCTYVCTFKYTHMFFQGHWAGLMPARMHLTPYIDVCACVRERVCVWLASFNLGLNQSMNFFLLFRVMSCHQSDMLTLF